MKFENIRVYNFENALRGMRNPKNSWNLSDSVFGYCDENNINEIMANFMDYAYPEVTDDEEYDALVSNYYENGAFNYVDEHVEEYTLIGPKDMKLAKALIAGGSEHRKFLRQIFVTVDITAPLFWFKEFDTYKVGTVANSTSTMHKLTSKPITLDCFDIDDYDVTTVNKIETGTPSSFVCDLITALEDLRKAYLETNDKKYWKELVRWLPEGWLQTRTVTMNYENLLSMVHQREHHKLTEWSGTEPEIATPSFIKFARSLPYSSDFIFVNKQS